MIEVDTGLAGLLTALPWTRCVAVLEATVERAGPQQARAQKEESAALDVQPFLAPAKRIADIPELEGDTDAADVRRSTAVGILGQTVVPPHCSPGTSTSRNRRATTRTTLARMTVTDRTPRSLTRPLPSPPNRDSGRST